MFMKISDFKNKRVLVLGLGLHGGGVAVARWLAKHGAKVLVSDIKTKSELSSSVRALQGWPITYYLGTEPTAKLLKNLDIIIQNPGVPKSHPFLAQAKKHKISIENEASLFLKLCPSKLVLGITGSKGKSTTTALLGAILKKWNKHTVVGGNIRDTVMFDLLDKIKTTTPVVLELSSWHLELVGSHHLSLPFALITNIFPEHLNRYKSFKDYIEAKAQIFRHQKDQAAIVLNYDNKTSKSLSHLVRSRLYWFSLKKSVSRGAFVKSSAVYVRDKKNKLLFKISNLKLLGEHNLANAIAAALLAYVAGVPIKFIQQGMASFTGLHDRLELVAVKGSVNYYNDTAATAPEATIAALQSFAGKDITLIAGGADKKLSYTDLTKVIKQRVKTLILLPGSATVKLQADLINFQPIFLASSMKQAVKLAHQLTAPGSIVIMSPGAASFGLFKHEFDRGEQFVKNVRAL